mmetsp:Transcript_80851/g.261820  ORF Transcript_80851/g.261820 Transcript_80851/m.261820 type:complete len:240 (-) Transcript_80851:150-869(-)
MRLCPLHPRLSRLRRLKTSRVRSVPGTACPRRTPRRLATGAPAHQVQQRHCRHQLHRGCTVRLLGRLQERRVRGEGPSSTRRQSPTPRRVPLQPGPWLGATGWRCRRAVPLRSHRRHPHAVRCRGPWVQPPRRPRGVGRQRYSRPGTATGRRCRRHRCTRATTAAGHRPAAARAAVAEAAAAPMRRLAGSRRARPSSARAAWRRTGAGPTRPWRSTSGASATCSRCWPSSRRTTCRCRC